MFRGDFAMSNERESQVSKRPSMSSNVVALAGGLETTVPSLAALLCLLSCV